jgi:diguanylate cyclase (GGDEF) domain
MFFSVKINNGVILDFRNIPIVISAIYGGPLAATISGIVIAGYRIIIFGISFSSIVSAITVIAITSGCIVILKIWRTDLKRWIASTFVICSFTGMAFVILLSGKINLKYVLCLFWISTFVISLASFYYVHYCIEANMLFRKLQRESTKDHLTGLNNVRKFDEAFNIAVNNSKKRNSSLSLLMIDVDYFKRINDTYGHQAGDLVLVDLGKILMANRRGSDVISRIGGEEFTVILTDCPKAAAIKVAENIRSKVQEHNFALPNGKLINITVSIGGSNFPDSIDEYDKLLEQADISLYRAKREGRNKVVFQ